MAEPEHSGTAFVAGLCETRIWGMTGSDRAERMLQRLGCDPVMIAGEPEASDGMVLYLRADSMVEQSLLERLRGVPNSVLVAETRRGFAAIAAHAPGRKCYQVGKYLSADYVVLRDITFAGLKIVRTDEFARSYDAELRKQSAPLAALLTDDNVGELEWESFKAAYKGVTDVVTKYAWPKIAFPITRVLARLNVTPNQVTTVGLLLSIATLVLFMYGQFAAGIACAWLMALLDTVDGKLARVTLTSSKWGNVFDHGIDIVAPPMWWLAWWYGLGDHSTWWIDWSLWVVLGGHLAGKLTEQAFISTFGFKIHMWQRFDSTFRLFTARRNPNLIILTAAALAGIPDIGYLMLAAWIVICFVLHTLRYVQAYLLRRENTPIVSWLDAK